jgi:hypothetical protein
MTNYLQQLKTWIALQLPTTPEKQTLYREVVRRAHTTEIISPWYTRVSPTWLPVTVMAFCAVLFISYNTNQPTTLEILPDQEHDYHVLSAYEQVDKINKEKASLQKIIKSLPSETVASNVAEEVKTIEQYIKTNPEIKPLTIESEITTTDTIPTIPSNTSSEKITLEIIQEHYTNIKELEAKKDYVEAFILIGETKKIIENEKIDSQSDTAVKPIDTLESEKDSNKKQ